MLQELFIAAAAGGNANNALSQMGFEHLIHEMTSKPGDFAVSWVVLLTLVAMSAMSWYWTVINIFKASRLKAAASRVISKFWEAPNAQAAESEEAAAAPVVEKSDYSLKGSIAPGAGLTLEKGVASWYGKMFHGRKTSSGDAYDMYAMTAAHPSLPIPSYVRVTNLANGRSAVVRVNDRGPFHPGRVIDLSYAAAYKLGYVDQGHANVEIALVLPEEVAMVPAARPVPPIRRAKAPAPVAVAASPVAAPVVAAVEALDLTGPLDLDIRRDDSGTPVVLEINARFGANSAKAPELLGAALGEWLA